MADGFKKILQCKEGGLSLVSASYANELIDILNAFGSGIVAPIANVGSMKLAGGMFVLDLTPINNRLLAIELAIRAGTIGGGGSGGGGVIPPFWIEATENNNATEIAIRSGTVNGQIPAGVATNIDVSGLDGIWSFFLGVGLEDNGAVDAAAIINVAPGDDPPSDGVFEAYIRIGNVTVDAGLITLVEPMLAWSQTFVACNRNVDAEQQGVYFWELA